MDEMERTYLPRLETRFESGNLGLALDTRVKMFTITNLRTPPGPDVTVYLSAIVRQRESGKRVFVEAYHVQPSSSKVEHLSVFEDWSFRFKEVGELDFHSYENLTARLASEDEFQEWLPKKNGVSVYYHFLE
jgi:hypothetical protein